MFSQLLISCHAQTTTAPQHLRTGADELLKCSRRFLELEECSYGILLVGNIAVVANQTSVVGSTHLVDNLIAREVSVTKIFCPEHGFRGTAEAGAHVDNSTDPETGLPIISLYGKNKKPTQEQLKDVDCVIFDLQDVGCRFYTYLSTLHYVMEACAEKGIPLLVLDRPNPNGHYVDGPVLDTARYRSFVGMHPVPVVYGMTIGEYALMINGEGWLEGGIKCNLKVVPMQGYRRDSVYALPVSPSPNLRNTHAIALYPSLCLFEGTNCGVGRGTDFPFEWVTYGADTLDLRAVDAPGRFSLEYLMTMYSRVPRGQFFLKKNNFFEKLAGTGDLRHQMEQGLTEEEIRATWQPALERFREVRKKYLIYPDTL